MIGDGAEPDHGIYTLLHEIVNNSVDEFTDGYCYRFCLLRC